MSKLQRPTVPTSEQHVERVASLYTHINDLRDTLGQRLESTIDYHLGTRYATEALGDKLAGLGVDSSWHLLDLCSGWGGPTHYVASRFGCVIVGVDITQRSVELAQQLTKESEVAHLISFRQGNALSLPIGEGEVDLVWSQDALCHIPHRRRALAECFRVLRPGGYLVFTDWLRTAYITKGELRAFSAAFAFPGLETVKSYQKMLASVGFEVQSAEGVGREYTHAAEALTVARGAPTFIQRTSGRDDENVRKIIEAHGLQAHLDRLEREKMDLYFAQGKLELGRFICQRH